MARILVSEADPDVRRLLVVLIERLGHEAIVLGPDVAVPPHADLMLLEPGAPACLEDARLARTYFPELPILCLNSLPAAGEFLRRGPLRYLPKPFTLDCLRAAVAAALAASPI
jgi:CheY-like chemotaxis protein